MPRELRQRRPSLQYPRSTSRVPAAKKRKSTHEDNVEATYELDTTVLGRITAKFATPSGRTWESYGQASTSNMGGFAWVMWEDESPGIVYKAEQRGRHVLVICVNAAADRQQTGFMNEVVPDPSTTGIHIVDEDSLGDAVPVYKWDELHRSYNDVGDHYFYRSTTAREACSYEGCKDTALSANSAYVVCGNHSCARTYHGHCLADRPLQYSGENVYSVASDRTAGHLASRSRLHCLACRCALHVRTNRTTQDQMPELTVIADVGTSRVRVTGNVHGKEHAVLDSMMMVRPICVIDPEISKVYFERRAPKKGISVVEPIKKLMCGYEPDVELLKEAGLEVHYVLKKFFREVLASVLENFQTDVPDLDSARVTFAVAFPAGLSPPLQNIMLNAMFACAKHVTPVLLNEAEMGYMGGKDHHRLTKGTKVLAIDIGGYTAVSTLSSSVNST